MWTADSSRKFSLSELPSIRLNQEQKPFKDVRYGLKDSAGRKTVLEATGDPLYAPGTTNYIGGMVWIKEFGTLEEVSARELEHELRDFRNFCDRMPRIL